MIQNEENRAAVQRGSPSAQSTHVERRAVTPYVLAASQGTAPAAGASTEVGN
jgi:hypothetical protein